MNAIWGDIYHGGKLSSHRLDMDSKEIKLLSLSFFFFSIGG